MDKIFRILLFLIASSAFAGEPPPQNLWHPLFKDEMLSVDAEKSLYRFPGDEKSLGLAIRITNNSEKLIGLELHPDTIVYLNQWGLSMEPQRSVIDERRMPVQPIAAAAKKKLLEDY